MRKFASFLALVCVLIQLTQGVARADVKVMCAIWVDQHQWKMMMRTLTPDQRDQMARMAPVLKYGAVQTALYINGSKARVDTPDYSVFEDRSANEYAVLIPKKSVCVMLAGAPQDGQPKVDVDSVQRTSSTKVILKHATHLYDVVGHVGKLTLQANIWAADDMPLANSTFGPLTGIALASGIDQRIKHVPLAMTLVVSHGVELFKLYFLVQSISTKPLPPDTFTIPAGYKIVTPARRPSGTQPPVTYAPGDTVGDAPAGKEKNASRFAAGNVARGASAFQARFLHRRQRRGAGLLERPVALREAFEGFV